MSLERAQAQRDAARDRWEALLVGFERGTVTLAEYEAGLREMPGGLLALQLVLVGEQLRVAAPFMAFVREVARRVREQG